MPILADISSFLGSLFFAMIPVAFIAGYVIALKRKKPL